MSLSPEQGDVQILVARSTGRPNFVRLSLMLVSPLYISCFVSPFWLLELCCASLIFFFGRGEENLCILALEARAFRFQPVMVLVKSFSCKYRVFHDFRA